MPDLRLSVGLISQICESMVTILPSPSLGFPMPPTHWVPIEMGKLPCPDLLQMSLTKCVLCLLGVFDRSIAPNAQY
jgi:hypothetical protein